MPRKILLGVGGLSIGALLMEHGFAVPAHMRAWLTMGDVLLAFIYVADRLIMLRMAPNRWRVLRARQFEFLVLAVFTVLGIALLASPALVGRIFQLVHTDDPNAVLIGLLKLFLLANVLVQMLRLHRRLMSRNVRPEWVLAGSFAMLILAGTLLLLVPRASADPVKRIGILDAFFTATSASCVTGLSVVDTGTDFSVFGQGFYWRFARRVALAS